MIFQINQSTLCTKYVSRKCKQSRAFFKILFPRKFNIQMKVHQFVTELQCIIIIKRVEADAKGLFGSCEYHNWAKTFINWTQLFYLQRISWDSWKIEVKSQDFFFLLYSLTPVVHTNKSFQSQHSSYKVVVNAEIFEEWLKLRLFEISWSFRCSVQWPDLPMTLLNFVLVHLSNRSITLQS